MSLINEALKKAQRQRNDDAADAAPIPGGRVAKRGRAPSANSIFLLGAGALVLVVVSVVITVYLVNRPSSAPQIARAPSSDTTRAPAEASPMVAVPPITPPAIPVATSPHPSSPAAVAPPVPDTAISALRSTRSPSVSEPANASPNPGAPIDGADGSAAASRSDLALLTPAMPPAELVKPDEGIYQYVDALRITGVKAAGPDSRVLMNDRVYRINDIVERTLGIRLLKVETNTLTFSDSHGALYVKNF